VNFVRYAATFLKKLGVRGIHNLANRRKMVADLGYGFLDSANRQSASPD